MMKTIITTILFASICLSGLNCDAQTDSGNASHLPQVCIVAYEGIEMPTANGSGYQLSPSSHQLCLNQYFGAVRRVSANGSDFFVVQLRPEFIPAAQAFMKASPKNIVTYVQTIEGHDDKYLSHMRDPSVLLEIYIPVTTKDKKPN